MSDAADTHVHHQSLRRAAYLSAGVGALYSILFLLSYWLVSSQPGPRASDAELAAFYASAAPRRLVLVGLYLMPFAGIAFVWFIVALRMWISASSRREDILLSNIQFVSGILFVGLFFAGGAAAAASAAGVEFASAPFDAVVARQLPALGNALVFVFAMRMAAMFVFATSNIGRTTGVLPRWFVFVGFAVGLFLLLSATFSQILVVVFPLWILVLCALLILRARRIPVDAVLPSPQIPLAVNTLIATVLLTAVGPATTSVAHADTAWKPGPGASGANTYAGVIDIPSHAAQINTFGALQVSGWFVDRTAQGWAGVDDVEVFLGLMNDGGVPLAHALFALPRPDVGTALGNPYWSLSGWSAQVPVTLLVSGSNTLTVYVHAPDKGWWFQQVSVEAPTAPPRAPPRPAATLGFDASFPDCGKPLSVTALGFAIVGVNGGRAFTPNPCVAREYAWALGGTSPTQAHLAFYMNTGNPGPGVTPHWPASGAGLPRACDGSASNACAFDYGWLTAQDAVARARTVAGGLATQVPWWLDVEVENSWSDDTLNNSADLQGMLAGLQDQDVGWIGIYALSSGWDRIIGSGEANAPFVDIPNWRPGAHSAAETAMWCTRTVTGGPVKFAQYPQAGMDTNQPCY